MSNPTPRKRLAYVCTQCGSKDIQWDASARWSAAIQSFKLSAVMDQAYCEQCESECDTKEIDLDEAALEDFNYVGSRHHY